MGGETSTIRHAVFGLARRRVLPILLSLVNIGESGYAYYLLSTPGAGTANVCTNDPVERAIR